MSLIKNKTAYKNYEIVKELEAGLKLKGYEVKSIKEKKGVLQGSYIKFIKNEPFIMNFCVPLFSKSADIQNYDQLRPKKLLLNKKEIESLQKDSNLQGYTIVPIKVYLKGSILKLKIGLAKGKKKHEKKAVLKEKVIKRAIEKETKLQNK